MRGQTSDPYERLLGEWQAKREMVNSYHRALHFLTPDISDAPHQLRARRQDLNEKLATALVASLEASDRLQGYEERRAVGSSH